VGKFDSFGTCRRRGAPEIATGAQALWRVATQSAQSRRRSAESPTEGRAGREVGAEGGIDNGKIGGEDNAPCIAR
jgi:hypothetical protein